MVIVNADDFGISSSVNKAIIECFESGLVSSTTIMPNMPGFEEACELVIQHKLKNNVGIHVNLTEGIPLTGPIRKIDKLCNQDGVFSFSCSRWQLLGSHERTAVSLEVRAQIERCRTHGLPLTHADSHHHIHSTLAFFPIISPVLRECGIINLRLSRNAGSLSPIKKGLKRIFNSWMHSQGFNTTDYFGDIFSFVELVRMKGGASFSFSFEIMVHPGLDMNGRPVDIYQNFSIVSELGEALKGIRIEPYPI